MINSSGRLDMLYSFLAADSSISWSYELWKASAKLQINSQWSQNWIFIFGFWLKFRQQFEQFRSLIYRTEKLIITWCCCCCFIKTLERDSYWVVDSWHFFAIFLVIFEWVIWRAVLNVLGIKYRHDRNKNEGELQYHTGVSFCFSWEWEWEWEFLVINHCNNFAFHFLLQTCSQCM